MKRFASTRSSKRARQPTAGRAQCSVGSIDDDGIRYGLTTNVLTTRTATTAPTIVSTHSAACRQRREVVMFRRPALEVRGDARRVLVEGAPGGRVIEPRVRVGGVVQL